MDAYVAWFLVLFIVVLALLGPRFGADTSDGADRYGSKHRPEHLVVDRAGAPPGTEPAIEPGSGSGTDPAPAAGTGISDGWSVLPGGDPYRRPTPANSIG